MVKIYKERLLERKLNTYFVCVADSDNNIYKEEVVPANPTCNCYSIGKAFTVLAIGLLYDKGLLNPDDKLVKVLEKYIPADIDQKWLKVTIHDVLLHKVGFGCGMLDIDCEDASLYPTNDYLQIIFNTKLKYEPGTVYQYTDAAYYLLSRVVSELEGIDLADYLRPILMDKMKFKEFAWSRCPHGYSMGATGLYLRTEDLVKLGILFLNKGLWMNERIISEEWVDKVLSNGYEFSYLKNGWYGKGGMRGQLLIFNLEKKKAVACHSYESRIPYEIFIEE
ncbi:MAG: beta-lactamase family protein [Bacilli bacterium]|nr:beta-lactamase family protein [Bacilli bacterium]